MDPLLAEEDNFSIVVVGAMNPRIHHPAWYQLVKLIDEPTAAAALTEGQFACLQPFATFRTSHFAIACQDSMWTIQTHNAAHLERIRDIAAEVFDTRLRETPISAFGLNFDYHRRTRLADVGQCLAERVALLRIGLETERYLSAHTTARYGDQRRLVTVRVEPSVRGPNMIFVGNNFQYRIEGEPKHFALKPLFDESFPICQREASDRCVRILAAVDGGV